jgi:hypothetical protein
VEQDHRRLPPPTSLRVVQDHHRLLLLLQKHGLSRHLKLKQKSKLKQKPHEVHFSPEVS